MIRIFFIGVVIVLLTGLSSCTLEKRHYRNGYYVDWNHNSAQRTEVSEQNEAVLPGDLPTVIIQHADSTSPVQTKPAEKISLVEDHQPAVPSAVRREQRSETLQEINYNREKSQSPLPLEKDKKQAIGAGIAAAIFFILGMVGLIIKGTGGSAGIFIGAAFVCFVLCVILASFLYPREPDPKNPDKPAPGSVTSREVVTVVLIFGAIVLAIAAAFLTAILLLFN